VSGSPQAEIFGTITLIYDHHTRLLPEKLTELQHRYFAAVLSTVHVHLDHDNCLEVVLVHGKSSLVQNLANALIATNGVKHGRFTLTASDHAIPPDIERQRRQFSASVAVIPEAESSRRKEVIDL
jgi:CopG family nickel-responsive transcriptional regulator